MHSSLLFNPTAVVAYRNAIEVPKNSVVPVDEKKIKTMKKDAENSVKLWKELTKKIDFSKLRTLNFSNELENKQVILIETCHSLVVCYDKNNRKFSEKTMDMFLLKLFGPAMENLPQRRAQYENEGTTNDIKEDIVETLRYQLDTLRRLKTIKFYSFTADRIQVAEPSFFVLSNDQHFSISFKIKTAENMFILGVSKFKSFDALIPGYASCEKYSPFKRLRDMGFSEEYILAELFKSVSRNRCYLILKTGYMSIKDFVLLMTMFSVDQRQSFFIADPTKSSHFYPQTGKKVIYGTYTCPGPVNYIVYLKDYFSIQYLVGDNALALTENQFHLTSNY